MINFKRMSMEPIQNTILRLIEHAKTTNQVEEITFNGKRIVVKPNSKVKTVYKKYQQEWQSTAPREHKQE